MGRNENEEKREAVITMLHVLPNRPPERELARLLYFGVKEGTEYVIEHSEDKALARELVRSVFREIRTGKRIIPEGVTKLEYVRFKRMYLNTLAPYIGM